MNKIIEMFRSISRAPAPVITGSQSEHLYPAAERQRATRPNFEFTIDYWGVADITPQTGTRVDDFSQEEVHALLCAAKSKDLLR